MNKTFTSKKQAQDFLNEKRDNYSNIPKENCVFTAKEEFEYQMTLIIREFDKGAEKVNAIIN